MNLHEYQAKNLLKTYSLPVPNGMVVQNVEHALVEMGKLNGTRLVVKAQVHAGGRGIVVSQVAACEVIQ